MCDSEWDMLLLLVYDGARLVGCCVVQHVLVWWCTYSVLSFIVGSCVLFQFRDEL